MFALSTEQLHRPQPPGLSRPDSAPVDYRGLRLFGGAQTPLRAFSDSV